MPVGGQFWFVNEGRLRGHSRGPWIKVSDRKYRHDEDVAGKWIYTSSKSARVSYQPMAANRAGTSLRVGDQYIVRVVPSRRHSGYDALVISEGIGVVAEENGFSTEAKAMAAGATTARSIARHGAIGPPNRAGEHAIHYSDGSKVVDPVVQIWEDNSTERRGTWYRAYWASSPEVTTVSPVFGYASGQGGPHKTVRATIEEVRRYHPHAVFYRAATGRRIK